MPSPKKVDIQILTSDLREFCDVVFVKYTSFRTAIKLTPDFPAYELAKLYLNIATSWLDLSKNHGLALSICKTYLVKCLNVFDNSTIDVCKKAKSFLANVSSMLNSKLNQVKHLENEMNQKVTLLGLIVIYNQYSQRVLVINMCIFRWPSTYRCCYYEDCSTSS